MSSVEQPDPSGIIFSADVPSIDPTDALKIGDRLLGSKLDAAIKRAASETAPPQQGEQTGGYYESYAHLSHIPMFPLYTQLK